MAALHTIDVNRCSEGLYTQPSRNLATLTVEQLSPADLQTTAAWDRFALESPDGTIYHLTAWRTILTEVFGHQTYYLLARDGENHVQGILPLVRLRSRLFGDYIVSIPVVNYGGPCAINKEVEIALVEAATVLADGLSVRHLELRTSREHAFGLPVRTDKVSMRLALPTSPQELWSAIGNKVRAQVKRPQKIGAECYFGCDDLLPEFYAIFSRNMRDLGTPVYPYRLFEHIYRKFPKQARIAIVRLAGDPVAAGFILGHQDVMEIPWASSLRKYNRAGVNMLLYWKVLEHSLNQGYKFFDFGRSTVGSGTYRFKKQWGAEAHQLYWYYWMKDGIGLPGLTPNNPKYRLAIHTWQMLPLPLANWLGPKIVHGLP
jgi:serine/alanine adding enzyme